MSTNTGVAPALWIVPAVAKNVNGVVMTSSPGFRFSALSGKSSASVPLAQPMPCLACDSRAISRSSGGRLTEYSPRLFVGGPAHAARRTSRARLEPLAALTHPADASRRHADHESVGR